MEGFGHYTDRSLRESPAARLASSSYSALRLIQKHHLTRTALPLSRVEKQFHSQRMAQLGRTKKEGRSGLQAELEDRLRRTDPRLQQLTIQIKEKELTLARVQGSIAAAKKTLEVLCSRFESASKKIGTSKKKVKYFPLQEMEPAEEQKELAMLNRTLKEKQLHIAGKLQEIEFRFEQEERSKGSQVSKKSKEVQAQYERIEKEQESLSAALDRLEGLEADRAAANQGLAQKREKMENGEEAQQVRLEAELQQLKEQLVELSQIEIQLQRKVSGAREKGPGLACVTRYLGDFEQLLAGEIGRQIRSCLGEGETGELQVIEQSIAERQAELQERQVQLVEITMKLEEETIIQSRLAEEYRRAKREAH